MVSAATPCNSVNEAIVCAQLSRVVASSQHRVTSFVGSSVWTVNRYLPFQSGYTSRDFGDAHILRNGGDGGQWDGTPLVVTRFLVVNGELRLR